MPVIRTSGNQQKTSKYRSRVHTRLKISRLAYPSLNEIVGKYEGSGHQKGSMCLWKKKGFSYLDLRISEFRSSLIRKFICILKIS
jgi:hypothetical protein